jgi:dihydrofolate reductase
MRARTILATKCGFMPEQQRWRDCSTVGAGLYLTGMRALKMSLASSLDGYIARLDGSLDWIAALDDDGTASMMAFVSTIDTVLIGRKTYDMARATRQPFDKRKKNFVFSRTLPAGWRGEVEVVAEDPVELVERLKQRPGNDIWLFGGYELNAIFLKANAVDEVRLAVQPVLLGRGIPLFPSMQQETQLRLVDSKALPNGVVTMSYRKV